MPDVFSWVLIIGLIHQPNTTLMSVRVPMVDEASCRAAEEQVKVLRSGPDKRLDYLGSVCEPIGEPK